MSERRFARSSCVAVVVATVVAVAPGVAGVGAATGSAGATGWTAVPHAQPLAGAGVLHGVACDTAECVAVGAVGNSTFAELRVGSAWERVPAPAVNGAVRSLLEGVACGGPHTCVAVGSWMSASNRVSALVEHWDGARWTVVPSANNAGTNTSLSGVWCGAPSSCVAVGTADTKTLIERWNGATWTVEASANPTRNQSVNSLTGVTCPAADVCFAVGTESMDGNDDAVALVERWDGTHWTVVPSASPADGNYASFSSVQCVGPHDCIAVGNADYRPLIDRWDGTRFHLESMQSTYGGFDALACASPTRCVAVGGLYGHPLAEQWDGNAWSAPQSVPHPGGDSELFGVACPAAAAAACEAVGVTDLGPLATDWDGSHWSPVDTASATITPPNRLNAISCPSATSCISVGSLDSQTLYTRGAVERWNGHAWSADAGGTVAGQLRAVSCATPTTCMAVGQSYVDNDTVLMSEQWNGTHWTAHPMQTLAHNDYGLNINGVSCVAGNDCTAVGNWTPPAPHDSVHTLVEHWDGFGWSVEPTTHPADSSAWTFSAIDCVDPTHCTAVGMANGSILVERWDGRHWNLVTTPAKPADANLDELRSVWCVSATQCVAAGDENLQGVSSSRTLIAASSGGAWSVQSTPGFAAFNRRLLSVACRAATDCMAVGSQSNATNREIPVAQHWDGHTWTDESPPIPAPHSIGFNAVGVLAGRYVAVGLSAAVPFGDQYSFIATHG
jgi:hypothetical protein